MTLRDIGNTLGHQGILGDIHGCWVVFMNTKRCLGIYKNTKGVEECLRTLMDNDGCITTLRDVEWH